MNVLLNYGLVNSEVSTLRDNWGVIKHLIICWPQKGLKFENLPKPSLLDQLC